VDQDGEMALPNDEELGDLDEVDVADEEGESEGDEAAAPADLADVELED